MMKTNNIAIFASGGGSNAESILNYFSDSKEQKVVLIVSNNKEAGVLEKAKRHVIPTLVHSTAEEINTDRILKALESHKVDLIVLAGYLRKIPQALLDAYPKRIVNIHPALLPKFGGKGMYGMRVHEAVVNAAEKESGPTIHYVNENYDEGDIIAQFKCEISPSDGPKEVQQKVLALEHEHYPKVIEQILTECNGI